MTATRTRKTTTQTRPVPWPDPTKGTSLHLIGDVHAGAIPQWRLDSLISDLTKAAPVAATIQLGDNTNNGLTAENGTFSLWRRDLGTNYIACGNHDLFNQTPAAWATQWGYPDVNYTADIGNIRLVVMGSDNGVGGSWSQIPTATLTWLDGQLASAGSRPVMVACHYPIWDTVGGDSTLEYTSKTGDFYVCTATNTANSNNITAVLAAHSNVVAWLSGHTHSSITVPGLAVPYTAGSRRLAHINASCLWYCSKHTSGGDFGGPIDPVHSAYFTWLDDHAEVRWRHHNTGQWYGPPSGRLTTITGLG